VNVSLYLIGDGGNLDERVRERFNVMEICAGAHHGGQKKKKKTATLYQYAAEPKEAPLGLRVFHDGTTNTRPVEGVLTCFPHFFLQGTMMLRWLYIKNLSVLTTFQHAVLLTVTPFKH